MTFRGRLTDLRLLGFSRYSAEEILSRVLTGTQIADLPGDFVVAGQVHPWNQSPYQIVVTSVIASRPYYYVDSGGRLFHGDNVFELAAAAGLKWCWNDEAVACLAWLGHTVSADTLHAEVRRVPCASVITDQQGRVEVRTQPFWDSIFGSGRVPVADAVDIFGELVDELLVDRPLVSLSGGFDSRALLARILRARGKPVAITMGHAEASDRLVADQIATGLRLDHRVVELRPESYVTCARRITRLTSGTKTAGNWHTYLYLAEAEVPGNRHFIGANGEFARSYYLDAGGLSHAANQGGVAAVYGYFAARIIRRKRRYVQFLPGVGADVSAARLAGRLTRLASGRGGALAMLDRFYATHRVRHFIGNGLALAAAHSEPVSPFLDARWIQAAGGLPRQEKLGANYHRRLIERNYPQLLSYPLRGEFPLGTTAPRGYWRRRTAGTEVPYHPFDRVLASPEVREIIVDSPHLDRFATRQQRVALVRETYREGMELLLTLHFAGELVNRP